MTVTTTLDADLASADFVAGPPDWLRAEALMADRETAAEATCECGHAGLTLWTFHKPEGRGKYRAFGVCPDCGAATEL
jgi:hypothetical protein